MAGFLGEARQWRKFEKRTKKLFRRYGVNIFHTIDVRRTDDDFEGWQVDKKIEFLDNFQHIVNETLEAGFASILRRDDYEWYTKLPWPDGVRKDSAYGVLFRGCLAAATRGVLDVDQWARGDEPSLNVVLESGHKNAGDAVRLYDLFRQKFVANTKPLSGLTFANKSDCLPLAAADLFAYSAYGYEVGQKPIGIPKGPTKSDASYRRNAYRIPINRDSLEGLFQQSIQIAREGV